VIAPVYKKFGGKVMVQDILVPANKRWEDLLIQPRAQCKITSKNCEEPICQAKKWIRGLQMMW
jgi:hypothetical protein